MFCSPFLNEDSNLFDSPLSQGLFGMCLNIDFFRGPDPYHQRVLQNLSKKKKKISKVIFFFYQNLAFVTLESFKLNKRLTYRNAIHTRQFGKECFPTFDSSRLYFQVFEGLGMDLIEFLKDLYTDIVTFSEVLRTQQGPYRFLDGLEHGPRTF